MISKDFPVSKDLKSCKWFPTIYKWIAWGFGGKYHTNSAPKTSKRDFFPARWVMNTWDDSQQDKQQYRILLFLTYSTYVAINIHTYSVLHHICNSWHISGWKGYHEYTTKGWSFRVPSWGCQTCRARFPVASMVTRWCRAVPCWRSRDIFSMPWRKNWVESMAWAPPRWWVLTVEKRPFSYHFLVSKRNYIWVVATQRFDLMFTPTYFGENDPSLTCALFSPMGWSNHQADISKELTRSPWL